MIAYAPGFRRTPSSGPSDVSFVGNKVDGGSYVSTHTLTSVAFGVADPTRRIVINVHIRASAEADSVLSSATIGGVAATIRASATDMRPTPVFCNAIYTISADVPTGTTGTVVLNFPNNVRVYLGVYRVVALSSSTPTDTDGQVAVSVETKNATLDVEQGGSLIAGVCVYSLSPTSLSGIATQDYSVTWQTDRRAVGAHENVAATEAARVVTASSADNMRGGLTAVAFR